MAKSGKAPRGPEPTGGSATRTVKLAVTFDKAYLLGALFGEYDQNLITIENRLGVYIAARGNRLVIEGEDEAAQRCRDVLVDLYQKLESVGHLEREDVDAAIGLSQRVARPPQPQAASDPLIEETAPIEIRTRRKTIVPRSPTQIRYMQALKSQNIIFGLGPAGTGKTYLAVAAAVSELVGGTVDRIILSRPAVEAGERLGFLPGDMKDKVDPYLRPLYDALYDMLPAEQVERRLASGEIEIAPLAFMRGRTLSDAFVILDEAQNTSPMQMKMFLTRYGQRCRMVVCGDPSQVDLPSSQPSGLADAVSRLDHVEGIALVRFAASEVVRHPLVGRIVEAYGEGG
jgi:phosphate starvation-inducible PhoH-like protein